MRLRSILCRSGALFQKFHRADQSRFALPPINIGQSNGRSSSYINPISCCWFSNAYSKEVPERHIPTTNKGPELWFLASAEPGRVVGNFCTMDFMAVNVCAEYSSFIKERAAGGLTASHGTTGFRPPPVPRAGRGGRPSAIPPRSTDRSWPGLFSG